MPNYKTTPEIAEIVYGLLDSITVPKFLFTKPPTTKETEYIVINSLPIDAYVMQFCYVNVNYYVNDMNGGAGIGNVPDIAKLKAGAILILDVLEEYNSVQFLIDFESQELIRQNDKEHYMNLRFSFKYINN